MTLNTVYIAASDELSVTSITSLLESMSYSVSRFHDERSLFDNSARAQPRFLLIHDNFEQASGNGFQVATDFASAFPETVIVALTNGQLDMISRVRAAQAGCSGLLTFDATAAELYAFLDDEYDFLHAPISVLVVDDSPTDGFSTCRHLKKAGFEAKHIESPYELLDACQRQKPDIIVCDYWMPQCHGPDAVRALRMDLDRRYASLPIIYLSSEKSKDRQLDAMARGADEFLTKPVDPDYLARTIQNRVLRARKLRLLSERDSMSGLFNHAASLEALRFEIDNSELRVSGPTAAVLDLDNFKHINDSYGHETGDQVIRSFSAVLKRNLNKSAIVGRLGGEEFLVIFYDLSFEEAFLELDRVRRVFCAMPHRSPEGETFSASFSAGMVQYDGISADLIHYAESALYEAKREGKNRITRTRITIPTAPAV